MSGSAADAGRRDEPIRLAPYDPEWPTRFEEEAAAIREVIGPWITGGVHHVGSTAVPGLAAKPIIDIQVGVADLPSSRPCIDLLARIAYLYAPYRADEMHWFCKPDPADRTHHLHLVPTDSTRFGDVIAFRDHLRAHPSVAREYERLKRKLVAQHANDRDAYTDAKRDFVRCVVGTARGRGD